MNAPRLHWKPHEWRRRVEPAELGLQYTSVERLELTGTKRLETGPEEVCLVCLGGAFRFACAGRTGEAVPRDMLYVPPGSAIELAAADRVEIARFAAPCDLATVFAHLKFAEIDRDPIRHKVYGKAANNCRRDVWNFIDDGFPAGRMLTGICAGAPGGWTAWPPHEHAEKREEVYVYFGMGKSFGVQLVYGDMDSPLVAGLVRDGDLVSVPRGYHPSVGCPAGGIGYIYCMVAKNQGERSFMDLSVQKEYGDRFE